MGEPITAGTQINRDLEDEDTAAPDQIQGAAGSSGEKSQFYREGQGNQLGPR